MAPHYISMEVLVRTRRSLPLLATLGVTAGLVSLSSAAEAQTAAGWALNRFDPTPSGDVFFLAEHPWTSSTRRFSAGLGLDFASNPLVQRTEFADGRIERTPIISGMLAGHVGLAYSFLDRVGLHVSLPVSLSQSGTASTLTAGFGPSGSLAVGDVRVGARVRLFGHADRDAFSLHLGFNAFVPTGSQEGFMSDGKVRLEPRLVLAGRGGPIRWSFGGGFLVRSELDALNVGVGNELRLTAAVGFTALEDRLTIGPEAYVVSAIRDLPTQAGGGSAAFSDFHWGGEALLGAHYNVADTILLGLGGGVGFQPGYGVPAARGVFTIAYAPITRPPPAPVDTDGDGVFDPDDQCPTVPQGATPDPNRRGCPFEDRDSDGVADAEDQCPDTAQGPTPDPNRRGCPASDRDGDGVLDDADQCPDTPAGDHPDPARAGCPLADTDSDGVYDNEDQCVDVPAGPRPSTTRRGCPAPDADRDGIIDTPEGPDMCPDRPETFNGIDDTDGCPDGETLAQQEGLQIRILQQINFRTDSDEITGAQSFRVLDSVTGILRAMTNILHIDVQGHTDDRGAADHNRDLSNRRAMSVVRYLTEHGIEAGRLAAHGFGPDCPLQPGTSRAARAANRRVQFVIVSDSTPEGRCVGAEGAAAGTQVQAATAPAAAGRNRRRHR